MADRTGRFLTSKVGSVMWHIIFSLFVIPVAVWILSSLFRGTEEQARRERQRMNPRPPGPGPARPRRPGTDIDTFLEEVNRRRQESSQRARGNPVPTVSPPAARPRVQP